MHQLVDRQKGVKCLHAGGLFSCDRTSCADCLDRGVGQPSDSSSGGEGSSDEGEEGEEADDSLDLEAAQAQWGVGALAANPAERIPDGALYALRLWHRLLDVAGQTTLHIVETGTQIAISHEEPASEVAAFLPSELSSVLEGVTVAFPAAES
jgi:hypothetical protein